MSDVTPALTAILSPRRGGGGANLRVQIGGGHTSARDTPPSPRSRSSSPTHKHAANAAATATGAATGPDGRQSPTTAASAAPTMSLEGASDLPPASALANRTGEALVQLLRITNQINMRRGSLVSHALPEGAPSPKKPTHQPPEGDRPRFDRRKTWAEGLRGSNSASASGGPFNPQSPTGGWNSSRAFAIASPIPPDSPLSPRDRFGAGASAARKFSLAIGLGGNANVAPADPMDAAKLRALIPQYSRRGGGVGGEVTGLDFRSGRNRYMNSPLGTTRALHSSPGTSPTHSPGPASFNSSPRMGTSSLSQNARIILEEDGGVSRMEYRALRSSRHNARYGTLNESKKALVAAMANAPKVNKRSSDFRQMILEAEEKQSTANSIVTTPTVVAENEAAAASAWPGMDRQTSLGSDAGSGDPSSSSSSAAVDAATSTALTAVMTSTAVTTMHFSWRDVLEKEGALRTEAELAQLTTWLQSLQISFFQKLSPAMMKELAKVLTVESFEEGDWVFRQGETGLKFYVVLEGKVVIVVDKTLREGEVAGQRKEEDTQLNASSRSGVTSPARLRSPALSRATSRPPSARGSRSVSRATSRRPSVTRESSMAAALAAVAAVGAGGSDSEPAVAMSSSQLLTPPNPRRASRPTTPLKSPASMSLNSTAPAALLLPPAATLVSPTSSAAANNGAASQESASASTISASSSARRLSLIASAGAAPATVPAVFDPNADAVAAEEGPVLTLQQQLLGLTLNEQVVAEATVGAGFGEVALISKSNARQASVKCVRRSTFLCLNKAAYDMALKIIHEQALNFKLNFVREVFLFHRWSYEKILQFTLCMTQHTFSNGHVFYRQRDRCDHVFFIVSGRIHLNLEEDFKSRRGPLFLREDRFDNDRKWVGGAYLKDEVEEAQKMLEVVQTAADEKARAKARRIAAHRWTHKSKKHRHVPSRYMNTTSATRERAVMLLLPPSDEMLAAQLEKDQEAARTLAALHSDELVFDNPSYSDDDDSDYTSTSSSEESPSDSAHSSEDEFAKLKRIERKRVQAKVRAKERAARRRRAKERERETGTHQELNMTDSYFNQIPQDGNTLYQFYKIHFDKKDDRERLIKVTLKPQFLPSTVLSPTSATNAANALKKKTIEQQLAEEKERAQEVEAISPFHFELFAGNSSCPFPTKNKHTWASNLVGNADAIASASSSNSGGANSASSAKSGVTRSILIRPDDPNFQSGWLYFSVFHSINEKKAAADKKKAGGSAGAGSNTASGKANTTKNKQQETDQVALPGPPYELFISNDSMTNRSWGQGSRYAPARAHHLSTLGPMDFFGAEEVIAQHEAAAFAAAGGQGHLSLSLDKRINYLDVGRICSATVCSSQGATILTIPKEQFMMHVRGNMLKELKLLLRRQLMQRAHVCEAHRAIERETDVKIRKQVRVVSVEERRMPAKPSVPRIRPQSAHPLSPSAGTAAGDSVTMVDSAHPSLSAALAAPFHHRPNLGAAAAFTQTDRMRLLNQYTKEKEELRLKKKVEDEYYLNFPDAIPLQHRGGHSAEGRELWVLDEAERKQAQRKKLLRQLIDDQKAEGQVYQKQKDNTSASPSRKGTRPATAPSSRPMLHASVDEKQESLKLLMPPTGEDQQQALVVVSEADQALIPMEEGLNVQTQSNQSLVPLVPSHPLNTISSYHILSLDTKAELDAQNRMSQRLFGTDLHQQRPQAPIKFNENLSKTSALGDGPIYGLKGSSSSAGTMSRSGMRQSTGKGLRNRWQTEHKNAVFALDAKIQRQNRNARENPFADPSLSNPWLYVPSLYDSAAHDPALNDLAIKLGIPQPKPAAQPRDRINELQGAVNGADHEGEDGQGDAATTRKKKEVTPVTEVKHTVEEALRLAEIEAVRQHQREEAADALATADVNDSLGEDEKEATGSVECPVPNALWQSEAALLPVPPPAKRAPFIAKTSLKNLATYVRFEPPSTTTHDVPVRYRNAEKRRKNEKEEEQRTQLLMQSALLNQTTATATAPIEGSDAATTTSTTQPPPPLTLRSTPRPGSASMFGSFIYSTAAAKEKRKKKEELAKQQQQEREESEALQADSSAAASDEDTSTIFSLTQIGVAPIFTADSPSNRESKEEQRLIVVPQSGSSSTAVTTAPTTGRHESGPNTARSLSPTSKHRFEAPGNRFLQTVDEKRLEHYFQGKIPQRTPQNYEAVERAMVLQALAEERATQTLGERIEASVRQSHPPLPRPQSARMAIKNVKKRAYMRPHRPPSIPSHTRPSPAADLDAQLLHLAAQARAAEIFAAPLGRTPGRQFSKVGRRADFQFHRRGEQGIQHWGKHEAEMRAKAEAQESERVGYITSPKRGFPIDVSRASFYADQFPDPGHVSPKRLSEQQRAYEQQLQLEWDTIDVVEEGERMVHKQFATSADAPAKPPDEMKQSSASAPPAGIMKPSTTIISRPTSALTTVEVGSAQSYALTRPTSAFPRPPSAQRTVHFGKPAGRAAVRRPQSAITQM